MGELFGSSLNIIKESYSHRELRELYVNLVSIEQLPAREAFMTICYLYEKQEPKIEKWQIPKLVANIINPDVFI